MRTLLEITTHRRNVALLSLFSFLAMC